MTVSQAWECLRGDPLPWLLDEHRPNLHWNVLTKLFERPLTSPAVARARGGADAVDPVASLIADFGLEQSSPGRQSAWKVYSGLGWRLVAAVQWGADPTDPRLQAVAEDLIDEISRSSGIARHPGEPADPLLTARSLQALADLGWSRHPAFQEALAWLEDGALPSVDGGWRVGGRVDRECPVTPVAVLGAIATGGDKRRQGLLDRAVASLDRVLGLDPNRLARLGHPCLGRTDLAEILSIGAHIGAPLSPAIQDALSTLQMCQGEGGRWRRQAPVPKSLPCGPVPPRTGPSRWVTLKCVTALMHYGVEAGLPRMYPEKPG